MRAFGMLAELVLAAGGVGCVVWGVAPVRRRPMSNEWGPVPQATSKRCGCCGVFWPLSEFRVNEQLRIIHAHVEFCKRCEAARG